MTSSTTNRIDPVDLCLAVSRAHASLNLKLDMELGTYHGLSLADFALLATVSRLEAFNYKTESYRPLHAWKTRLQQTLPYYGECNDEGMTMFKHMLEQKKH